jgi:hypothetical protein
VFLSHNAFEHLQTQLAIVYEWSFSWQ